MHTPIPIILAVSGVVSWRSISLRFHLATARGISQAVHRAVTVRQLARVLLYTLLICCVLAEQRCTSSRQGRLLLGEQIAKDIFHSLPELETLVRIEDHSLHECLGLLTTRFPNGFDGQATLCR
jgi:hypothetical protein